MCLKVCLNSETDVADNSLCSGFYLGFGKFDCRLGLVCINWPSEGWGVTAVALFEGLLGGFIEFF